MRNERILNPVQRIALTAILAGAAPIDFLALAAEAVGWPPEALKDVARPGDDWPDELFPEVPQIEIQATRKLAPAPAVKTFYHVRMPNGTTLDWLPGRGEAESLARKNRADVYEVRG